MWEALLWKFKGLIAIVLAGLATIAAVYSKGRSDAKQAAARKDQKARDALQEEYDEIDRRPDNSSPESIVNRLRKQG